MLSLTVAGEEPPDTGLLPELRRRERSDDCVEAPRSQVTYQRRSGCHGAQVGRQGRLARMLRLQHAVLVERSERPLQVFDGQSGVAEHGLSPGVTGFEPRCYADTKAAQVRKGVQVTVMSDEEETVPEPPVHEERKSAVPVVTVSSHHQVAAQRGLARGQRIALESTVHRRPMIKADL